MRLNKMNFIEVVLVFISLWNMVFCRQQNHTAKDHFGAIDQTVSEHLVLIGYKTQCCGYVTWGCSGALIDPRKVVTHAECVTSSQLGPPRVISYLGKQHQILNFTTSHDIAVLFLKELLPQNTAVCLSATGDNTGTGIIGGWGGLSSDNKQNGTIDKDLSVDQLETFEESEDFIKARPKQAAADHPFFKCIADLGGPIQIQTQSADKCKFHVFGVLSAWDNCGQFGSFGVYRKLERYIKWIESL